MANYSNLKSAIQQVIKANGNNEITGAILQSSLVSMITSLGDGYQFKGVATTATTPPSTPDQRIFYLAGAGTYSNFGSGMVVPEGYIGAIKYDSAWSLSTIMIDTPYITNFESIQKCIDYDNTSWRSGSPYASVLIPLKAQDAVVIVNNTQNVVPIRYAFLTSNNTDVAPSYVSGASMTTLGSGIKDNITVSQNCYMYVEKHGTDNVDFNFDVYVNGAKYNAPYATAIGENTNNIENISDDLCGKDVTINAVQTGIYGIISYNFLKNVAYKVVIASDVAFNRVYLNNNISIEESGKYELYNGNPVTTLTIDVYQNTDDYKYIGFACASGGEKTYSYHITKVGEVQNLKEAVSKVKEYKLSELSITDGDGFMNTVENQLPESRVKLIIDKNYSNDWGSGYGGGYQAEQKFSRYRETFTNTHKGFGKGDIIVGEGAPTLTRTFIEITGDCTIENIIFDNCGICVNPKFQSNIKLTIRNCQFKGYSGVSDTRYNMGPCPHTTLVFENNVCDSTSWTYYNLGIITLSHSVDSIIKDSVFTSKENGLSSREQNIPTYDRILHFAASENSVIKNNYFCGGATGIEFLTNISPTVCNSEEKKENAKKSVGAFIHKFNVIEDNSFKRTTEETIGFDAAGGFLSFFPDYDQCTVDNYQIETSPTYRNPPKSYNVKYANKATITLSTADEYFEYRVGMVIINVTNGHRHSLIKKITRNSGDTDYTKWDIEVEEGTYFYYENGGYGGEDYQIGVNDVFFITGGYYNNIIKNNLFEGFSTYIALTNLCYKTQILFNKSNGYGGSVYFTRSRLTDREGATAVLPYAPIADNIIRGNYLLGAKLNVYVDAGMTEVQGISPYSEQRTIVDGNLFDRITCSDSLRPTTTVPVQKQGKDIIYSNNTFHLFDEQKGSNIVYRNNIHLQNNPYVSLAATE